MLSRPGPGSAVTRGRRFTGKGDGDRGNRALDVDTVRLLKTQDIAYVRTVRNIVAKEVRQLREAVVLARGADGAVQARQAGKGNKIVFVENEEEQEVLAGEEDGEREDEDVETGEDDFEGFDDLEGLDNLDDLRGLGDLDFDFNVPPSQALPKTKTTKAKTKPKPTSRDSEKRIRKLEAQLAVAEKKLAALTEAERQMELQRAKMAKTATSGGHTKKGRRIVVQARKR